jgi:hypothetical protein
VESNQKTCDDVAMTLNNLGNLHSDQKRMEVTREAYEEAQGLSRAGANQSGDLSA